MGDGKWLQTTKYFSLFFKVDSQEIFISQKYNLQLNK